jgi:hypothetical protein
MPGICFKLWVGVGGGRAGSLAQVVECLPSKHEVLSWTPELKKIGVAVMGGGIKEQGWEQKLNKIALMLGIVAGKW